MFIEENKRPEHLDRKRKKEKKPNIITQPSRKVKESDDIVQIHN